MQALNGDVFEFYCNHPFRLLEKVRSWVPLNLDIASPENDRNRMPFTLNYTDYFRSLKPSYRQRNTSVASIPSLTGRSVDQQTSSPFDRSAAERRSYPKSGVKYQPNGSDGRSPMPERRTMKPRSASHTDDLPYQRRSEPSRQKPNYGADVNYHSSNTLPVPGYHNDWEYSDDERSQSFKVKKRGSSFLTALRRFSAKKRKKGGRNEPPPRAYNQYRNSSFLGQGNGGSSNDLDRQRNRIYPDDYSRNQGYYPPSDFSYDGSLPMGYDRDSVFVSEDNGREQDNLSLRGSNKYGNIYRENGLERPDQGSPNAPGPHRGQNGGVVYYYPGSETRYVSDPRSSDRKERDREATLRERSTRSRDSRALTASQYIPSRYELTEKLGQMRSTTYGNQQQAPNLPPKRHQGRQKSGIYTEDEDYDEIDDEGAAIKEMTEDFRANMNVSDTPPRRQGSYQRSSNRYAGGNQRPATARSAQNAAVSSGSFSGQRQDDATRTTQNANPQIRRIESNQSLGRTSRQPQIPLSQGGVAYSTIKRFNAPVPPERRLNAAARERRNNRSTDV